MTAMTLKSILSALKSGEISAADAKQRILELKQRDAQFERENQASPSATQQREPVASPTLSHASAQPSATENQAAQPPALKASAAQSVASTASTGQSVVSTANTGQSVASTANIGQQQGFRSLYAVDKVAIIGQSGRYPGAENLNEYWQNLKNGVDSVQEVPTQRWNVAEYYDPRPNQPGKVYCKWLGAINEPEFFDPLFFNIAPAEAEAMDPQFRLFLQESYHAFEDAGYSPEALNAVKCGVYLGIINGEYNNFLVQQTGSQSATGASNAIGASRIAYYLNLKGPAIAMDTACSSSLVAMHIGCQNLLSGDIDMALIGGVSLYLTPTVFMSMCAAGMLSREGRCKTFDNSADGFVPGEGVGTVIMKRLSDAERDHDNIYATVIASGSNQDGKTNGITAPSKVSQTSLIREVYQRCDIDASSISYVDMHGTGTKLGDPIELEALANAFSEQTSQRHFCAIGSVKSNIGHSSAAAGVASIHKILLQMRAGELVPSLHFSHPNEHFDFAQSPFYVSTKNIPWKSPNHSKRRAAVSSFGYSGTNVHIVLEEYPQALPAAVFRQPELILLSAHSATQLQQQAQALITHISAANSSASDSISTSHSPSAASPTSLNLANIAHTLRVGRGQFAHRMACVAETTEQLLPMLQQFVQGQPVPQLWQSAQKPTVHAADTLDENPQLRGVIQQWIESVQFSKVAELWARGVTIPWRECWPATAHNKVSLPGYPFAREPYWPQMLEASPQQNSHKKAIALNTSDATLNPAFTEQPELPTQRLSHPLLPAAQQGAENTLQFPLQFTGDEFFFTDHQVQGRAILPAVAYLDLACAAMFAQWDATTTNRTQVPQNLIVKNTTWFAPFSPSAGQTTLALQLAATKNSGEYQFIATAENASSPCSQSVVTAVAADAPPVMELNAVQQRCGQQHFTANELYAVFTSMGLQYGPAHQGAQAIHVGEAEVLAQVCLPASLPQQHGFVLHPAMLDAVLQTSLMLPSNSANIGGARMPFALAELRLYRRLPNTVFAWIRSAKDSSERLQKLDVDICDSQGQVCVQLRGFSSREVATSPPKNTPIDDHSTIHASAERNSPKGNGANDWVSTDVLQQEIDKSSTEKLHKLVPSWQSVTPPFIKTLDTMSTTLIVSGPHHAALSDLLPQAKFCDISAGASVEGIQAQLQNHGKIERLIWLVPASEAASATDECMITEQESGVRLGFRLVKALLALNYGVRALQLTVVTQNSQAICTEDPLQPSHASIHGFIGSLSKEYHNWLVRLVDIDQQAMQSAKNQVWKDILRLSPHPFGDAYAYRQGEWFQRMLIPLVDSTSDAPIPYRQNGTYIVIGGAGGIGRVWSEWVCRHYNAQVIWIGRREQDTQITQQIERIAEHGPAPWYVQADASDKTAFNQAIAHVRSKLGNRAINGVIHSAIVLADKSVANMDETTFLNGLNAKVDVSVNLAQAFEEVPLDWMCFFSSLQSFTKEPGQCNYAAGCTFKDAFAQRLNQRLPYPVKTLNWGFWGSIGIVSKNDYRERMAADGIGSIEPEDGMVALQQLLAGELPQWALLKTTRDEVLYNLCPPERMVVHAPHQLPTIQTHIPAPSAEEVEHGLLLSKPVVADIEAALIQLLWVELQKIPVFSTQSQSLASLGNPLHEDYQRWLAHTTHTLVTMGYVQEDGEGFSAVQTQQVRELKSESAWANWAAKKENWLKDPRFGAQVTLAEKMLAVLPRILRGEKPPTDILFQQNDTITDVYTDSGGASYYNQLIAAQVQSLAASYQQQGKQLRVLEIGAGTGGTSISIFDALQPYQATVAEYCFTDISRAFLLQAQERFAAIAPYLNCQLLNIEQSPAAQQFATDQYDVVVATNVLHATSNIRRTLHHSKALLKTDGVLLINEIADTGGLLTHLTFGLMKGWWLYEDEALRIPGSPALSPATWRHVLASEGYQYIQFPAQSAHALGSQVIAAYSDGCVRVPAQEVTAQLASQQRATTADLNANAQYAAANAAEAVVEYPQSNLSQSSIAQPHDLASALLLFLQQSVSKVLKLAIARIDSQVPLEHYGMDSILSVQLTTEVARILPDISSTLFLEYQTLDALSAHLLANFPEELKRALLDETLNGEALISDTKTIAVLPEDSPSASALHHQQLAQNERTTALHSNETLVQDIAVIGMACKMPNAETTDQLWQNLMAGKDAVTEVPASRWDHSLYFDADKSQLGKTACKWGSFVDGIDQFDPLFFNISPNDAEFIDPQVRLMLHTSWALMEASGYTREKFRECCESNVGVYIGAHNQQYQLLETDYVISAAMSASAIASIPNRISNFLDLCGPSFAIDTFCSSSMIAIHSACNDLRLGETDMAIAGGINHLIHPKRYLALGMAMLLGSDHTQSRSFGCGDGFIPSEGAGVIMLKRLQDAERDNDEILAVVKSTLQYHGGAGTGYGTTNQQAYSQLIRKNFAKAGIAPSSVSFVESAANGNALSDAVAISAMKSFFKQHEMPNNTCGLGSIKSNFGHLEAASGVMQFIKVVLQMQHKQLPPTIYAEPMNPNIQLENSPFVVHREVTEWQVPSSANNPEGLRRAVVNTFGGGGSLAQAILEEYVTHVDAEPNKREHTALLIPLSARSAYSLQQRVQQLQVFINEQPETSLSQLSHTLIYGREAMEYRCAFVASDLQTLSEQLDDWVTAYQLQKSEGTAPANNDTPPLFSHVFSSSYAKTDIALAENSPQYTEQLQAIAQRWLQGESFNWHGLFPADDYRTLALPSYPFDTRRCWAEPVEKLGYHDSKLLNVTTSFEKANQINTETLGRYIHSTNAAFLGLTTQELSIHEPLSRYQLLAAFLPRLMFHLRERLDIRIDSEAIMSCRTTAEIIDLLSDGNSEMNVPFKKATEKKPVRRKRAAGKNRVSKKVES